MNYKKYTKAQELDSEIRNTEKVIKEADEFIKNIDEEESNTAMFMVGNRRFYFDKRFAKIYMNHFKDVMKIHVANKKKEFKAL